MSSDLDEGIDYTEYPVVLESYYPTRLEYLAGKIVVGLLTGKSEKSFDTAVIRSVQLAKQLEEQLDSAQS